MLESESHARMLADAIQRITADLGIPYVFKASYDKANRTSISSFRGPGLVEGCRILKSIADATGLPVLTDVHTPEDCARVSDALGDAELVLQIPAFLCRQTDLLIAAAQTGRGDQREEGPVRGSGRHAARGAEAARLGQRTGLPDRARGELRLQQPGGGYALAADHAGLRAGGV